MPIQKFSAAVVVASIDLAIGSSVGAVGYLLPYHRCFSDIAQPPGSTSEFCGALEQTPDSTAENGMDDAGDAAYFLRAVARSIFVGGVWAFSSLSLLSSSSLSAS